MDRQHSLETCSQLCRGTGSKAGREPASPRCASPQKVGRGLVGQLGIDIQGLRIDVDEEGDSAFVENHISRGDERERRRDYKITLGHAACHDGQMQPSGATGYSDRVADADKLLELRLKTIDEGAHA